MEFPLWSKNKISVIRMKQNNVKSYLKDMLIAFAITRSWFTEIHTKLINRLFWLLYWSTETFKRLDKFGRNEKNNDFCTRIIMPCIAHRLQFGNFRLIKNVSNFFFHLLISYLLDLVLCDFWLFPIIKLAQQNTFFAFIKGIKVKVITNLRDFSTEAYWICFQ